MQPGHVSGTLRGRKCVRDCTEKDACLNSLKMFTTCKNVTTVRSWYTGVNCVARKLQYCQTTSKMGRDVNIIYMKWLEQNQDDSFDFAFCLLVFGPALSGYEIQYDCSTHFYSINSKFNRNHCICIIITKTEHSLLPDA